MEVLVKWRGYSTSFSLLGWQPQQVDLPWASGAIHTSEKRTTPGLSFSVQTGLLRTMQKTRTLICIYTFVHFIFILRTLMDWANLVVQKPFGRVYASIYRAMRDRALGTSSSWGSTSHWGKVSVAQHIITWVLRIGEIEMTFSSYIWRSGKKAKSCGVCRKPSTSIFCISIDNLEIRSLSPIYFL